MMLTFGKCGTATSNNSKIHELLKMAGRKCEKHEHCTSRNFNECLVLGTTQNVRQKVRETRALHVAKRQRVSHVAYLMLRVSYCPERQKTWKKTRTLNNEEKHWTAWWKIYIGKKQWWLEKHDRKCVTMCESLQKKIWKVLSCKKTLLKNVER